MNMKYRADIDGLRAIAIVLVLMYHAGLSLFPSGFIGVDVFFVISGFLITSIIHDSITTSLFSFVDFYNRRLWRLQPVFLCLLLVCTVLTLICFLPDDLIEFNRSARKTVLFISNSYFNKTTTGYFSPEVHQLPLLHTWSLSIEWQCYFLLPVLMFGLYKLFKKQHVVWVMYGLTAFFAWLTLYYSEALPTQSYYQLSSRIVAFFIGSCVALNASNSSIYQKFLKMHVLNGFFLPKIVLKKFTIRLAILHFFNSIVFKNKYVKFLAFPNIFSIREHALQNMLAILALASIFYVASLDRIVLGYPNGYAFIVCLSTGLLIWLGQINPTLKVTKALSMKPIVFIGVLSYSLYIWHWPVLSIIRYQSITETPIILFVAFVITGLISYVSWRLIEWPTRQCNKIKIQYSIFILLFLPILFIHFISYIIKIKSGYPQRFNQELVSIYQQLNTFNSMDRPLCIGRDNVDVEKHCRIGSKDSKSKSGFLFGDSFSNHYWGFMDAMGKDAGISILAQGTSSCLTLPGIALYDWWIFKDQVYQECVNKTQQYYKMIRENHYDYVILAQIWHNYFSDHIINQVGDELSLKLSQERIAKALDKALSIIVKSGAHPVLVKSTAIPGINAHDCFFKHIKLRQAYHTEQCQFKIKSTKIDNWFDTLIVSLKVKYPELIVIDPKKVQCNGSLCYADWKGVPIYRDEGHITDYASYHLGLGYLKQFGNPLS